MANLKEIRSRITSVSSTMQITNAMKMVSAAKLKRAQDAITAMRPYSQKLTELLQQLSATMEGDMGGAYAEQRDVENVLIVAVTSNRGLAGAFNSNVIKQVRTLVETDFSGKQVDLVTLGKKGNDILKKEINILENNNEIVEKVAFKDVSEFAERLMELFSKGKYDKIMLVYTSFINAATQEVLTEQFLPIVATPDQVETDVNADNEYLFEPSQKEVIESLIPKSLKNQLLKAIRDSVASEHGARMTAMHKATDNATELRDDLTLQYNKARQAAITNEILEIVGGAEALAN